MNSTIKTTLILAFISLIGCTKDDSTITPAQVNNNKFTIDNNVDFPTKSCYVVIDDDDDDNNNVPDSYGIWLLNGEMLDNDLKHNNSTGEFLFSVGQTYLGALLVDSEDNPGLVNNAIQAGVTYNCKFHFAYNISVSPLPQPYFENGIEYGEGEDDTAISHETENGTITFTSYSADVQNQTGTLEFDYSFVDDLGVSVQGHFDGQTLVIFD